MLTRLIQLGVAAAVAGTAFLGQPSAAQACSVSTNVCTTHYNGLTLYTGSPSRLRGEIEYPANTNNLLQKLINYDSNADRISTKAAYRDDNPGDGDAIYVSHHWYVHGSVCYVSGLSTTGGSYSCAGNLWASSSSKESTHIQDSGWWFYTDAKSIAAQYDSYKVEVRICQDEFLRPDECNGPRILGASWN